MAYPAGLKQALQAAIEEALQTPSAQAAIEAAGGDASDISEVTVSNGTFGSDVVPVSAE